MLKSGIYGLYKDNEYEITIDMESNIKIMTEDIGKTDNTFIDVYNSGLYTKIVDASELQDCIKIAPYGIIDGEKVQILQERESEYQVSTSSSHVGSKIRLPRIDRDTWLGWVSKNKIKLVEEKSLIDPYSLK